MKYLTIIFCLFCIYSYADIIIEEPHFLRGDANVSGVVEIADADYILNFLFKNGPLFQCEDAADVNADGVIDLNDPTHLLTFLFGGGNAPPNPGAFNCGPEDPFDPEDMLTCVYHPCND